MVVYVTSTVVDPPVTLFMGEDKHENEDLIKWGWPEDVWFHVDKLSSAHVYLRLRKGDTLDNVPSIIIEEACQLVKDNSITGRKQGTVDVVYTMWSNLKKTPGMEVGQVGFFNDKEVRLAKNVSKKSEVVRRLDKTKDVRKIDFRALREERDAKERATLRERERKQREEEKLQVKKRADEAELRSYASLMNKDKMKTNREQANGSDSDDFM